MDRGEFKRRWELDDKGDGITFDEIADCAQAWGIAAHPHTMPIDQIRYQVLLAADTVDAEHYNPDAMMYDEDEDESGRYPQ